MKFIFSAIIGILLLASTAKAATPLVFTVDADWQLTGADTDWLLHAYIPSRFEAAKQINVWLNQQPLPSSGEGLTMHIHLRAGLFPSPTHDGILVAGEFDFPTYGLSYDIYVDWDYEVNRGQVAMSHELGHFLQFICGYAGWLEIGHGTPGDPILQKLLIIGRQVYMSNHAYDPFKPTVY